jgi:hypothetical protein
MSGGNPEKTRLEFANNTPVIDLINALKQGKRFDTPDLQQMSRVKGFAWGTSINTAPTPKVAEQACKAIKARLPTESEYDFLSILGDWNGGVSLGHQFWALADNHIMSPDTRNPSPVRHPEEINGTEFSFYCVR